MINCRGRINWGKCKQQEWSVLQREPCITRNVLFVFILDVPNNNLGMTCQIISYRKNILVLTVYPHPPTQINRL